MAISKFDILNSGKFQFQSHDPLLNEMGAQTFKAMLQNPVGLKLARRILSCGKDATIFIDFSTQGMVKARSGRERLWGTIRGKRKFYISMPYKPVRCFNSETKACFLLSRPTMMFQMLRHVLLQLENSFLENQRQLLYKDEQYLLAGQRKVISGDDLSEKQFCQAAGQPFRDNLTSIVYSPQEIIELFNCNNNSAEVYVYLMRMISSQAFEDLRTIMNKMGKQKFLSMLFLLKNDIQIPMKDKVISSKDLKNISVDKWIELFRYLNIELRDIEDDAFIKYLLGSIYTLEDFKKFVGIGIFERNSKADALSAVLANQRLSLSDTGRIYHYAVHHETSTEVRVRAAASMINLGF